MMDSLGDRMKKNYESVTDIRLVRRMPVVVRVDGRCCHSLAMEKPFDERFAMSMRIATVSLAKDMQGFKLAYTQSDEASFLLTDYDALQTEAWFNYELRKIVSLSAAIFTAAFNRHSLWSVCFDARAFNVPREDVANYFLWRARDWQRNSVQMLAQAYFSHQELHQKNQAAMHEMLHSIGINWADLPDKWKNGYWLVGADARYDILPKYAEIATIVDPLIQERNREQERDNR